MGSGQVWLGGFGNWPCFKLDFDDPISTFDMFRSLLIVQDHTTSPANWSALKILLEAMVKWIVLQWEARYEVINLTALEKYSENLKDEQLAEFLDRGKCPFDGARFAISCTRAVDRTRLLDVAELKLAVQRFGNIVHCPPPTAVRPPADQGSGSRG